MPAVSRHRLTAITLAVGALVGALLSAPPASASSEDVDLNDIASVAESAEEALDAVGVPLSELPEVDETYKDIEYEVDLGTAKLNPATAVVSYDSLGLEIALPVDSPAVAVNDSIAIATESDGDVAFAVVPTDDSTRILAVADENYSEQVVHEYRYDVTVGEGVELRQLVNGDIVLVATDAAHESAPEELAAGLAANEVIVGGFVAPWAVDAAGETLPTTFELDGGTLIQRVDTAGASFPVVSDPLPLVAIFLVASVVARVGVAAAARAFAVYVPRIGLHVTSRTGYSTFSQAKAVIGNLKPNYDWHHIVVQANTKFSPNMIHNTKNLIQVPRQIHQQCLTKIQNQAKVGSFLGVVFKSGQGSVSKQVQKLTYQQQYDFGVRLLQHCGVKL